MVLPIELERALPFYRHHDIVESLSMVLAPKVNIQVALLHRRTQACSYRFRTQLRNIS